MVNLNQKQSRQVIISNSLPKMLIVGVQKAGTTSLHRYLEQHPNLLSARDKEVNFFSKKFDKGIVWYANQFPTISCSNQDLEREKLINFESTPVYIFYPHALRRIAETIPKVKLVLLLRNPIERAYSQYSRVVAKGKEELSFAEATAQEEERIRGLREKILADENYKNPHYTRYSYLARSRYIEQVKELYSLFPSEQILILKSEDLFNNPKSVLKEVFQFLNLSYWEIEDKKIYNQGQYQQEIAPEVRQNLVEYFRPYNEQLYEFLGRDFGWQ